MDSEEMKRRTKQFAINVGVLTQGLPDSQINRAKSNADFINKLKIVEEELDESLFFLELLAFFNQPQKEDIGILYREGETLLKIIVASIVSSRK